MLEPESGGTATKATMHTTMNVTGRPAQFGRGVMVEVGGKLVEQFAQNLRQLITDGSATAPDAPAEAGAEATGTVPAGTAGAGAGASAVGAGTAPADGGSVADAGPGPSAATADDRTTAITPPVTAPAATTASAPPAASADSINLIRLVGPAILKRIIPVAAVLAVLAVLGRRIFRRGAKK
jgi:hypothetical protein